MASAIERPPTLPAARLPLPGQEAPASAPIVFTLRFPAQGSFRASVTLSSGKAPPVSSGPSARLSLARVSNGVAAVKANPSGVGLRPSLDGCHPARARSRPERRARRTFRPTGAVNRKTITVETKPQREGQKSRSFSVELLSYVLANDLWDLGAGGKERNHRPVFLAYAGTDQACRAFSANLRSGRPAVVAGNGHQVTKFEVPKSAGFRYETFSREGATLTLAYLPAVFGFQPPTADSGSLAFLCLPPTWWVEQEAQAIRKAMGENAREAAVAAYFVAFLDQRSPLPIANDLAFHLELYQAALEQPWCQQTSGTEWSPGRLFHTGLEAIGYEPALYCNVDHATFGEFLKAQTARHLPSEQETTHHGTTPIRRPRRLLPDPVYAAAEAGLAG